MLTPKQARLKRRRSLRIVEPAALKACFDALEGTGDVESARSPLSRPRRRSGCSCARGGEGVKLRQYSRAFRAPSADRFDCTAAVHNPVPIRS